MRLIGTLVLLALATVACAAPPTRYGFCVDRDDGGWRPCAICPAAQPATTAYEEAVGRYWQWVGDVELKTPPGSARSADQDRLFAEAEAAYRDWMTAQRACDGR